MSVPRSATHGLHALAGGRRSIPSRSSDHGLERIDRNPNVKALRSHRPRLVRDAMDLLGNGIENPSEYPKNSPQLKIGEIGKPNEDYEKNGSSGRTRTYNPPVNSRMLCH